MKIKKIIFLILFVFCQNIQAQSINCSDRKVELQVKNKSRNVYFFFRKTNIKKIKRTDKVVNQDGEVIVKCTMKSTSEHDQFLYKKFHRIVIIEKQIHEVQLRIGDESGKLKIYDFCGNLVKTENIAAQKLFDMYEFNVIPMIFNFN